MMQLSCQLAIAALTTCQLSRTFRVVIDKYRHHRRTVRIRTLAGAVIFAALWLSILVEAGAFTRLCP
nr:hypothetical protein Hi04_10k_c2220_00025 [uncultured bacterium]